MKLILKFMSAVLFLSAVQLLVNSSAWAASCCGGGSGSGLILPKFSRAMLDLSTSYEHYNGFWDNNGDWVADPQGSDLNQYRLNFGYAHRLAPRWQVSASLPYTWNKNQYSKLQRDTNGIGDSSVSVWYEAFDKIACVWEVNTWADLMPAIYWGGTLNLPTGISPYGDVQDNFDITGRGFYRFDASVLIDKTIYPWNASFSANYGKYLERPINREYGTYVEPYDKKLGDRFSSTLTFGYTHFTDEMNSITTTFAYSYLKEDKSEIDGITDPTSGFRKKSMALTLAWATHSRDWVTKLSWSHSPTEDGWGYNFPATDVITVGVSHVLR
ncbi:MAG: hypothetical protein HOM14_07120 [Gammaproteobacteria bacterium]|jgi:hypothetical protein|nr:hypothetical protein [Gammaproteobacteria bacterium]MBT3722782.1 hypothetical protein [Gammaproteobacteria bacterium]MBT4077345.1 hypothetical protein [Gammaproteobacteria bacterium]MBT4193439.1 hypothetical protein [Gammaproteobacteria bacterium]MBT4450356.1 hypothetical protein [Gammaproteobacteria bacterium]